MERDLQRYFCKLLYSRMKTRKAHDEEEELAANVDEAWNFVQSDCK